MPMCACAARWRLAVDNQVLLDLGQNGQGIVAENHHVAPVQPEYSPMPPISATWRPPGR
jgi:hypothetical protein